MLAQWFRAAKNKNNVKIKMTAQTEDEEKLVNAIRDAIFFGGSINVKSVLGKRRTLYFYNGRLDGSPVPSTQKKK